MCVRIHPVSLQFNDDGIEAEVRAKVFNMGPLHATFFGFLMVCLMQIAGYGLVAVRSPFIVFLCAALFMVDKFPDVLIGRLPSYCQSLLIEQRHKLHTIFCWLGVGQWLVCIGLWWYMLFTGKLDRIQPGESERLLACCALWVVLPVFMHVIHVPFPFRLVVLASSLTIILSGDVVRPLLLSLIGGELSGSVLELTIRNNFRERWQDCERLREEKERVVYELMLAQKQRNFLPERRSLKASSASSHDSEGMNEVQPRLRHARSHAETITSCGTSSEICDILEGPAKPRGAASGLPSEMAYAEYTADAGTPHNHVLRHGGGTADSDTGKLFTVPLLSEQRLQALWCSLDEAGIKMRMTDESNESGESAMHQSVQATRKMHSS